MLNQTPLITISVMYAKNEKELITSCAMDLNWTVVDAPSFTTNVVWFGTAVQNQCYAMEGKGSSLVVFNRFPGMQYLTRKRSLAKVLRCLGQLYPESINFFPETFFFPEELESVRQCLSSPAKLIIGSTKEGSVQPSHSSKKNIFILKPDGGSQGAGLKLVNGLKDMSSSAVLRRRKYVLQRYIENPMKLKQKKFDIRVYSLITKVSPELEAYIGTECLARFCTENYVSPHRNNLRNVYMHYTNFSINKSSRKFTISTNIHSPYNSKRHFHGVLNDLQKKSYDSVSIWSQIVFIVQETLLALQPLLTLNYIETFKDMSNQNSQRCFQILGFDILLDDHGRAWLLEVNSNPSLRTTFESSENTCKTSRIDHYIKYPLVKEGLKIVQHRFFNKKSTTLDTSTRNNPAPYFTSHITPRNRHPENHSPVKLMSRTISLEKNDSLDPLRNYANSTCSQEREACQQPLSLDPQEISTLSLLGDLRYWMPIAFPLEEKKVLEEGIGCNSSVHRGKALIKRLRRKDVLLSKNSVGWDTAFVCWGFVEVAIDRYWKTSSQNKRLLFLCRKLFEKATFFPQCTSIESMHWKNLTQQSRMREVLHVVKIPHLLPKPNTQINISFDTNFVPFSRISSSNEKTPERQHSLQIPQTNLVIQPHLPFFRNLSDEDLELLYHQKLLNVFQTKWEPHTRDSEIDDSDHIPQQGLGFWDTWQLLISSLLHIAQLAVSPKSAETSQGPLLTSTSVINHPNRSPLEGQEETLAIKNLTHYFRNDPKHVCNLTQIIQGWPDAELICQKVLREDPAGLARTTAWFFQCLLENIDNSTKKRFHHQ